jgi:hypothetical protein
LGRRFHQAFHLLACDRGWPGAVEYCDLAKVLRLPGTLNFKDLKRPQPVTIHAEDAAAFTVTDFDDLLPPQENLRAAGVWIQDSKADVAAVVRGDIVLQASACPPHDRFRELMQLIPEFRLLWYHRRRLRDESQSGYDLALAYRAAQACWSDQEIADLLIANRRKFGADPKLRPDYYRRTIAKARTSAARYWAEADAHASDDLSSANEYATGDAGKGGSGG